METTQYTNQHVGGKTPMPDQIDQSLRANIINLQKNLLEMIDLDNGLVDKLHSSGVLDYKEMQMILQTSGLDYKIGKLLDYINEMSHAKQEQFLLVLEEAGQKHVAMYIRANGQIKKDNGCWPVLHSGANELKILQQNWSKVRELIDSENGLLDELLAIGCINRRHQLYIESAKSDYTKRNLRLLSIMHQRSVDDYYKFIQCLSNTEQHHVAYILAPEKTSTKAEPLNETLCHRLDVCHVKLIEDIDTENGLLDDIFGAMCITRRQYEHIKAAYSPSERNKRLLEIMRRGSQANFEKFMECLSRAGQQHLCQLLGLLRTKPISSVLIRKRIDWDRTCTMNAVMKGRGPVETTCAMTKPFHPRRDRATNFSEEEYDDHYSIYIASIWNK